MLTPVIVYFQSSQLYSVDEIIAVIRRKLRKADFEAIAERFSEEASFPESYEQLVTAAQKYVTLVGLSPEMIVGCKSDAKGRPTKRVLSSKFVKNVVVDEGEGRDSELDVYKLSNGLVFAVDCAFVKPLLDDDGPVILPSPFEPGKYIELDLN